MRECGSKGSIIEKSLQVIPCEGDHEEKMEHMGIGRTNNKKKMKETFLF